KYVKVYDTTVSDWVAGQIVSADKEQIKLLIDGTEKDIPFNNIAKAKLLNS
ncbi:MAG: ribosome maturation factor, partial [Spirochaetaceae bacterium]|nr:ribosome maturation factor [Spirochaetaceae bacterium]